MIKNIAVFCASAMPQNAIYREAATELGTLLAKKGKSIVYGGASVGLMDALASAALQNGGQVTGVITEFLADKEIAKTNCTKLIVAKNMSERKTKILEIADAVIALPGAFGTMDELFETLTLVHLNLYNVPVGLLNTNGYFNLLLDFLDKMASEQFLQHKHLQTLTVASSVETLLNKMTIL
ncbi:MAG: TIGR00730 family Rossman fold protein [Prevotellaceae bacterium]|jgi:uncharacterized protein (TIGR00730 family)|nr:TIGR00730 family Rossman fold protein [Prevotellaceae bacterium]